VELHPLYPAAGDLLCGWSDEYHTPCGSISLDAPYISFDVTHYAPLVPGAMHWFDVQGRFPPSDGEPQTVESIEHGPFETVGELLDAVRLNYKTLREIFDTEYDDGAVCWEMFDG